MKDELRLDYRPSRELVLGLDAWRRAQPDLPSRAEATRRLVTIALSEVAISHSTTIKKPDRGR